ncbi:low molecular weight phosphatase family protein [Plantibacter sp. RU18]|uniref:arsenate reductase/protein-tyrosine-phosphatase family protein n=1 Tax=Plantibacter sp. RU18 TaxID=3158143 RepID=UPI003D363A0A
MTGSSATTDRPFTVLFVCTGNICRSALGAQILSARLAAADVTGGGHPIVVSSAGTGVGQGLTMPDEVVEQSIRFGGSPEGHVPTPLDRDLVAGADLILTATRDHRSDVARMLPRASRITFTMPQFARLAADAPAVDDPWELVNEVAAQRGSVAPPEQAEEDDIEDPYRRGTATYARVGDQIHELVSLIADRLAQAGDRA